MTLSFSIRASTDSASVANPGMSSLSADHTSAAGSQFAFTRSIFTVLCRFLNDEHSVNDRNPSACCEGQVLLFATVCCQGQVLSFAVRLAFSAAPTIRLTRE